MFGKSLVTEFRFPPRTAVAIVIANMIGTGVFVSLGYQLQDIQSPFVLLMLWLVGGVTALCGALTYAELGANLPRSGGEYHFLSRLYHPMFGFISGWVSVTVGFAAPTALVAMTFAAYLQPAAPGIPPSLAAISLVLLLAIFHSISRRSSSHTQMIFTSIKVLLLTLFVLMVLTVSDNPQPVSLKPMPEDWAMLVTGTFAVALIFVGYAYTGWNAAVYMISEMEDPRRHLPLVLVAGTSVVMVLYIMLNYSFLLAAPMSALEGETEIALIAARYALGDNTGYMLISIVFALLFVSTVSAMTMAGPRVLQVIGEDFVTFRWLSRTNRHGVPVIAIVCQSLLAVLFILTASFESVLLFTSFVLTLNTFITILGVFVLRWRGMNQQGAYKTWGYPITPLVYLAITSWTLVYIMLNNPVEGLAGLAIIFTGALFYLVTGKRI